MLAQHDRSAASQAEGERALSHSRPCVVVAREDGERSDASLTDAMLTTVHRIREWGLTNVESVRVESAEWPTLDSTWKRDSFSSKYLLRSASYAVSGCTAFSFPQFLLCGHFRRLLLSLLATFRSERSPPLWFVLRPPPCSSSAAFLWGHI